MQFFVEKKKKIEIKFHPYAENSLIRKLIEAFPPDSCRSPLPEAKKRNIQRYAPKCYKSLEIEHWKDFRRVNALKRIKKIDHVIERDEPRKINQWRLVLQNKFKLIQVSNNYCMFKKSLVDYRAFLNVKKVVAKENPKESNKYQRIFSFLPGMIHLKSLDLEISRTNHCFLLNKLNSMTRILSSLDQLEISLDRANTTTILPVLNEKKNILKQITHLNLGRLENQKSQELFQTLPEGCKKLRSIYFEMEPQPSLFIPKIHYLQALGNFAKLESIEISVNDPWKFIEDFTAPSSLKEVKIGFSDENWDEKLQKLFSRNFVKHSIESEEAKIRNNKTVADFYKRWLNLKNLVSLTISTTDCSGNTISIFNFAISLLTNISSDIETFAFSSSDNYSQNLFSKNIVQKINKIDLSHVFIALQSIGRKLQTIELSFPSKYSVTLKPISEDIIFPELTLLKISENAIWNVDTIKNILDITKKPVNNPKISLDKVFVSSNQEFFDLLETLQRTTRNITLELEVPEYIVDMKRLNETLREFVEKAKLKRRIENVSLNVRGIDTENLEMSALLSEIFGMRKIKEI